MSQIEKNSSMNYLTQTNDAIDLVRLLITSIAKYSIKRIENKNKRLAYVSAIKKCAPFNESSLCELKEKIKRQAELASLLYKKSIFNTNNSKIEGHALACQHAMDIVNSINKRFIVGEQYSEYKYTYNIGEVIDEDESFY